VNAVLRPAAEFALGELAALYAATRRDYLVSLPMDAAGLAAYLARGSVSLAHSWVAVNRHGRPLGMLLLGLRGERAWLTRMGVLPHARRDGLGGLLLQKGLQCAHAAGARMAQLEVIEGNAPALALFTRFGFVPRRLLRVLDRAGGPAQDAGAAALPLSALALAGWNAAVCLGRMRRRGWMRRTHCAPCTGWRGWCWNTARCCMPAMQPGCLLWRCWPPIIGRRWRCWARSSRVMRPCLRATRTCPSLIHWPLRCTQRAFARPSPASR
jgi:GNAT superfamily N-acetyltransferase